MGADTSVGVDGDAGTGSPAGAVASEDPDPPETRPADDSDQLDAMSPDDVSMFGFVLVTLLVGYALVGVTVLGLSAYSSVAGWTLFAGRPYWVALCWPMGLIGLLAPAIMKLDDVTEVKRTPPVLGRATAGYAVAAGGLLLGTLVSYYPIGLAGAAATAAFTLLCLQYVWIR